jgi:hypothetical protein
MSQHHATKAYVIRSVAVTITHSKWILVNLSTPSELHKSYTANRILTVDDESEMMWNEAALAYFKVLY